MEEDESKSKEGKECMRQRMGCRKSRGGSSSDREVLKKMRELKRRWEKDVNVVSLI